MNYVILNDVEYYKNNIVLDNFKEVSIHGNSRVDGVFGTITQELLEDGYSDSANGNRFFDEEWLCRDKGTRFVVIRIPQNILYSKHSEYIKECFELFNKESFYIELWSVKCKNKEKYEYFIIGFHKDFNFKILFNKEFYEIEEDCVVKNISEEIEKKIFKE